MPEPAARPDDASRFERDFHRAAERHERIWLFLVLAFLALLGVATMGTVIADIGVVTKGAGFVTRPDATPATFHPGLARTGPDAYEARILARLWAWTPDPLHIPQNAAVTFRVTSADVLHGFMVERTPINLTVIPGVIGTVTYTFRKPGLYRILCNEYCGRMHQAMTARIVVDPAPVRP